MGKKTAVLPLSTLRHTWILDLDGTLVKHNGYKIDGEDSFLPGAKEFLKGVDDEDMVIILTSRQEDMRSRTEEFLRRQEIRFDVILYGVPYGERIVINDNKPSGLCMAVAVEKERDTEFRIEIREDEDAARKRMQTGK